MRRLLQSFIHNRKLYDRPQDEWTCGRAGEGCPCIFGPSKKGECRATGQCLPARKGDRWVCTRAISLGGACQPGPGADGVCGCPVDECKPVRSLRSRRGRVTRLTALFAAGFAVMVVLGKTRTLWSSPGPVSAPHAMSAQQCSDCHVELDKIPRTGVTHARQKANNQLCLNCHDLGANGNSPHGITAEELLALGRKVDRSGPPPPMLLRAAHTVARGGPAEPACATCHQEHHGREANIKEMSDRQCQVCHQAPFTSFVAGHPAFTDYPATRRTRLEFDHLAHWTKHFSEARFAANAPTSCADCHEPAADGRKMLVRGFEKTCAACHADQISGAGQAGAKGLVFVRLPEVDVTSLEKAGVPIGEWPDFCEGDITPFMRWMLEADPTAQKALAELDGVKLANLATATPAQKAAAAKLVWSVKGLMADLVTQGQQVMLRRLGPIEARNGTVHHTGGFSADGLQAAQQAWLPNLLTEVAAYRQGVKPSPRPPKAAGKTAAAGGRVGGASAADYDDLLIDLPTDPRKDDLLAGPAAAPAKPTVTAPTIAKLEYDDAEARVAEGGWYRRDEAYTVYYRPRGHADEFLTAWLETSAREDGPAAQAIFAQLSATGAPGLCLKCHTVDYRGADSVVNWQTSRPEPHKRPFTTFKHAPHFSLMGVQGCATCHMLDAKADYPKNFGANRDPLVFRSNFAPLTKDSCNACHQPQLAGSSCLQCHNYHTGELAGLHLRALVKEPVKTKQ
jgi:cytochrome c5